MQKPISAKVKKMDWIDAGRGFAILFVILCHAGGEFLNDTFFHHHFTHFGMYGVQLFFLLSSYTLMHSYAARKKGFSVKHFYIRRFFRIAPLYYVMLGVYCLITYFYPGIYASELSIKKIVANLLFLNTFYFPSINYLPPGSWSISVEMMFYILAPLFFIWVKNLKKAFLLFGLFYISSVLFHYGLFYYITHHTNKDWEMVSGHSFYYWLPNQLPIFFIGFLFYWVKNYCDSLSLRIQEKLAHFTFLAILMFFLASFINFSAQKPFIFIKTEIVYSFIFLILSLGLSYSRNFLFINPYIIALGKVSFSVYLTHFIFITISIHFIKLFIPSIETLPLLVRLISAIIYILFIALISYYSSLFTFKYIEQKGMEWGKFWIQTLNSKP